MGYGGALIVLRTAQPPFSSSHHRIIYSCSVDQPPLAHKLLVRVGVLAYVTGLVASLVDRGSARAIIHKILLGFHDIVRLWIFSLTVTGMPDSLAGDF